MWLPASLPDVGGKPVYRDNRNSVTPVAITYITRHGIYAVYYVRQVNRL